MEVTMKTSKALLWVIVLIGSAAVSSFAQKFTFTTSPANASGPRALIDMPGLTGNPLAIIVATPIGETEMLNPHPIGVWYIGGKWYLCNVDIGVMPPGAKYRIQFFQRPGPNNFLHNVTNKNLGAEGSYIDSPVLNNNPNAQVSILQNHAPEVRSPFALNQGHAKAAYSSAAGRWYIYNADDKPLPIGCAFNVVVGSGGGTVAVSPTQTPGPGNTGGTNPGGINPTTTPTPTTGGQPVPPRRTPVDKPPASRWVLRDDLVPTIAPNAKILLFIHGMDSRAEEADDITKALFALMANRPTPQSVPASPPVGVTPQNAAMVPVLQGLVEKYKACILEKYETKADMTSRGLDPSLSNLAGTAGLQDRDTVACVAGNLCSRSQRQTGFAALQTQANKGDATNFQTKLEQIIPKDCFQCTKHQEYHTKHVHCTMEAGGNFGVPQGIAFEGCKAGVDLNALAMTIRREINGVINNITGTVPPSQATGGPSIATNYSTVTTFDEDPESCPNPDLRSGGQPTAVLPAGYYAPLIPTALLDSPPPPNRPINQPAAHNIGLNEGRLIPELRKAAADADPQKSLRLAAYQFADGNTDMGKAYADLSVTGRRSFNAFRIAFPNDLPKEPFCQTVVTARPAQLNETNVLNGCYTALDRAYRVANFLRTGQRGDTPAEKIRKTTERDALGWIAVSGEDDQPHRPVNVPSSDYPQYDIDVVVEAPMVGRPVTVHTRYVIAQSATENPMGTNLVVISLDLPTSGYTENLNYDRISPLESIGRPKWTPLPVPIVIPSELLYVGLGAPPLPPGIVPAIPIPPGTPLPDFEATGKTPLLQFIEDFIVRFAERLDEKVPVKNNFAAVMGGSLGGNMTFRLGRRPGVPWLPKFIVWSPASIWNSLGEGSDILKHIGPRKAWEGANAAHTTPGTGDRAQFFGSWDEVILPILIPMAQSDTWTSNYYQCKKSAVAAARLDRHETYDANFLAWHWRLGGEQLLYSHQTIDQTTGRPRYMSNTKPMFLSCGTEDHVKFNDICPATQRTAPLMTMTPGKALFLERTGHSLDNERPNYFARQIIEFLGL